jgi:uncharacterized protein YodC (DUF2158 family)
MVNLQHDFSIPRKVIPVNATLKVGDTVRLKSGGALMTVEGFNDDAEEFVVCVWFEGKKAQREVFKKAVLALSKNVTAVSLGRS